MPENYKKVHFEHGSQTEYDSGTKNPNSVFFCTDSRRLFVGESEYTRPVERGSDLPAGTKPPGSLYVRDMASGVRRLYYSEDGNSWILVSAISADIRGGVFGENTNLNPKFGDTITIPKFELDDVGTLISSENQQVKLPSLEITVDPDDEELVISYNQ